MSAQVTGAEEEKRLIEACQRGERGAFEQIYRQYEEKVYSLTYYLCKQHETAKDLTQQVFLKAFVSLDTFNFQSRFGTWLYRLTTNLCIDERRKQDRIRHVPMENNPAHTLASQDSADAALLQNEFCDAVEQAISKLSDTLRPTFVLKYIADLSYTEISEVLDCSIGTVGSRLNSCLKFMAQELKHFKD
jgi:RNA polymerase sigma-70 factor (ECF subfamily)